MTRTLKTYVGRHQHPVVTHTSRVDWDEAAFTQGGAQPTSSRIIIRDEDGEYGPNKDNQQYVLGYHNVVRATEDASGSDVTIFRGRIEVVDTGRGPVPQKVDRYREHELTVSDYNRDLFGIDVVNFETRPGQNDKEQVQYLVSQYLSGSRRASTNLNGSNYVSSSNTQLIGSNVYSGVTPFDVLQDIADRAAKEFFVDVDGNLHYDGADSLAYLSSIRISDRVTDQSSNTYAPEWVSGAAKHHEGTDLVTSVRSYYGPDEDTTHNLTVTNTNDDKWDFWQVPFFDSLSQTEGAAERRATGELNYSGKPYVTATCRIGPIPAEWMGYIKGGQKIQVKARAMPGQEDSFEWLKIAELSWQYVSGDPTKAMATLVLERPRVRRRGAGGGSRPGATGGQPPPECEPGGSSGFPSEILSADWRTGDPQRQDPITMITGPPWGHIGQVDDNLGLCTRVDGTEPSQWFAVTGGTTIQVSFASARIGGSVTSGARVDFDAGADGLDNFQAGYCGETGGYWSYVTLVFNVPMAATFANFRIDRHACIAYLFVGQVGGGGGEECPPDSISPGSGGTSPYFARFDDPRFDADDQHLITRLSQRVDNNSGVTLEPGDVVIPDITYAGEGVTRTTTANLTDAMVGVVETGGAAGAQIVVIWQGVIRDFFVNDGTATSVDGDYLYTSTTAGAAGRSTSRSSGAVGRTVRDTSGDPSYVLWWGVPDTASVDLPGAVRFHDIIANHSFLIEANRGDVGNSTDGGDSYPEDTLEGFRQAAYKLHKAGVPGGVEIDIQQNADDSWVAMHDTTVTATTTSTGNVNSKTDAQWAALVIDGGLGYNASRHGSSLTPPFLDDIFDALEQYDVYANLELKGGSATELVTFLESVGWTDRVVVTCTAGEAASIKAANPNIACMHGGAGSGSDFEWTSIEDSSVTSLSFVQGKAPLRVHSWYSTFGADQTTSFTNMLARGVRSWETYDLDGAITLHRSLVQGIASDHGALTGLADDDHTQYTRKSTLTTTGDIYYASSASTPARLGIGTADQVLTVAGGVPTWADGGGIGEILISDSPSTPLVFADLVQNEAQNDLVYGDP